MLFGPTYPPCWRERYREEVVAAMDMSVVSRELEEETKYSIRGTVNGRIPRMLLIQASSFLNPTR